MLLIWFTLFFCKGRGIVFTSCEFLKSIPPPEDRGIVSTSNKGYIDDVKGDHGNKTMMQVKEVIQEELIESDFQKINITLLSCRLSSFDLNQSEEGKKKTSLCFSDDVLIIQTLALISIYRSYWNK